MQKLNSSTTDERIATQECSTGVTEVGIIKMLLAQSFFPHLHNKFYLEIAFVLL